MDFDERPYDLIVVGGGAAGYFAAIACAEARPGARVVILEKSSAVLGKVKISGGGRCNVTHACFEPRALSAFYPRGGRALIGPFSRWGPTETITWYEQRGVALKTEADNRVFPQSDSSQSIIDCLTGAAESAGVDVRTRCGVEDVRQTDETGWQVALESGNILTGHNVLLAMGGTRNRLGRDLALKLGHRVLEAAPSLFTFKINDSRIEGLQGVAVANATLKVVGGKLEAAGPVLVTYWGLSGPGILRVSAWGARELHERGYQFEIQINWSANLSREQVLAAFQNLRQQAPRRKVVGEALFGIPTRLWQRLVYAAAEETGAPDALRWAHLPRQVAQRLADQVVAGVFRVQGKSMNKDEFVTCGGVDLREVDFKTMRSRRAAGLYFSGEILDIDGITGGFNFQAAWTTGYIAGSAVAETLVAP